MASVEAELRFHGVCVSFLSEVDTNIVVLTIKPYSRYPQFPPPVRFPELFPFPFFARKGFRGFGIPNEIIDQRLGKPCQANTSLHDYEKHQILGPSNWATELRKVCTQQRHFEVNNSLLIFKKLLYFRVSAGVTLITDEKRETGEICLILVDTGSATKRMELLKALSAVGVMPEYINNLVLTHLDLDTVGNMNLFPDANTYVGNRRVKADTVYFPKLAPSFVGFVAF